MKNFSRAIEWLIFAALVALVLLVPFSCHADVIPITPSGNTYTIGMGLTWNTSGPTGTNNTYVFAPQSTTSSVTMFVVNHNASNTCRTTSGGWTVWRSENTNAIFGTTPTQFTQIPSEQVQSSQPLVTYIPTPSSGISFISANGSAKMYARIGGAAQIAFTFNASTSGGCTAANTTVDFYLVQSNDTINDTFGFQISEGTNGGSTNGFNPPQITPASAFSIPIIFGAGSTNSTYGPEAVLSMTTVYCQLCPTTNLQMPTSSTGNGINLNPIDVNVSGGAPTNVGGSDPCVGKKSSVVINIGSATTTSLVATSGTTAVYVCGYSFSITGTSPTYKFEYGTTVTNPCDTGTNALTGTVVANTATAGTDVVSAPVEGSNFTAPSGNALCIVSGGTGPSLQGYLTYVQQ